MSSSAGLDIVSVLLTSFLTQDFLIVIALVIASFAAFRSFSLSRALATPIYRRRALWLGVLNVGLLAFAISFYLGIAFPQLPILQSLIVGEVVGFTVFVWIDSTINVALEQDYFHRNTLHWRELRIPFWIGVAIAIVATGATYLLPPSSSLTSFSTIYLISSIPFGILFAYAAAVLAVSARRTTDAVMRTHFLWISVALLFAIVASFTWYGLFLVVGDLMLYFFYRAARSLYPMGHFEGKP